MTKNKILNIGNIMITLVLITIIGFVFNDKIGKFFNSGDDSLALGTPLNDILEGNRANVNDADGAAVEREAAEVGIAKKSNASNNSSALPIQKSFQAKESVATSPFVGFGNNNVSGGDTSSDGSGSWNNAFGSLDPNEDGRRVSPASDS